MTWSYGKCMFNSRNSNVKMLDNFAFPPTPYESFNYSTALPKLGTVCLFKLSSSSRCIWASLMAQTIKNLPAMWETWVQSLGWEDPLEEGVATHSSILVWKITMYRGAWRPTVHRDAKSQTRLSD